MEVRILPTHDFKKQSAPNLTNYQKKGKNKYLQDGFYVIISDSVVFGGIYNTARY